jgi:hypothetical protein
VSGQRSASRLGRFILMRGGTIITVIGEGCKGKTMYSTAGCLPFRVTVVALTMLGGSLVSTAWRVLRLRMEGSPPSTEGSCEYIE